MKQKLIIVHGCRFQIFVERHTTLDAITSTVAEQYGIMICGKLCSAVIGRHHERWACRSLFKDILRDRIPLNEVLLVRLAVRAVC
eukprot:m.48789 g.48789  ORF g.48789 m.48789 type:complete len:85 (-) comp15277_c0_seq2:1026-1280(-)